MTSMRCARRGSVLVNMWECGYGACGSEARRRGGGDHEKTRRPRGRGIAVRITEPRTRHGALTVLWYKGTLGRARGRGRRAAATGHFSAEPEVERRSGRLCATAWLCMVKPYCGDRDRVFECHRCSIPTQRPPTTPQALGRALASALSQCLKRLRLTHVRTRSRRGGPRHKGSARLYSRFDPSSPREAPL